jgi:hypothetical protein
MIGWSVGFRRNLADTDNRSGDPVTTSRQWLVDSTERGSGRLVTPPSSPPAMFHIGFRFEPICGVAATMRCSDVRVTLGLVSIFARDRQTSAAAS